MKLKRTLVALLSAAIFCTGGSLTAMAADVKTDAPLAPLMPGQHAAYPYTVGVEATIQELNVKDGITSSVTVKGEGENGQVLVLNISKETVVLDTTTGLPGNVNDLKKGEKVFAYHDAAMTRSLPPQAHAQAILVNLDKNHAPAHLLTAEQVSMNVDGSVTLLAQTGSVLVKVGKDTPISPLFTKNVVRNTDIHMGTRIFAWYDIVAMSMPGQAQATKVVILPNMDKEVTIVTQGDIAIGKGKVEDGVVMVPLRLTAEALGFKVTWDGKTETVNLTNGKIKTSVVLGEDSYYKAADGGLIGMSKPTSLGAAAYEVKGISYAPAELFNLLFGSTSVKLIGNTLYL